MACAELNGQSTYKTTSSPARPRRNVPGTGQKLINRDTSPSSPDETGRLDSESCWLSGSIFLVRANPRGLGATRGSPRLASPQYCDARAQNPVTNTFSRIATRSARALKGPGRRRGLEDRIEKQAENMPHIV